MPVPDFESYKVVGGEVSSATKFSNFVQAVEDEFADIDQDQVTGLTYTSYSPTWASSGTQPVLNNGVITASYFQIGKFIHFKILLTAGSTTTFGTGTYTFTLPVTANVNMQALGTAWAVDAGVNQYGGFAFLTSSTTVSAWTAASPAAQWGQTVPFTFGNTDLLQINGMFEAA